MVPIKRVTSFIQSEVCCFLKQGPGTSNINSNTHQHAHNHQFTSICQTHIHVYIQTQDKQTYTMQAYTFLHLLAYIPDIQKADIHTPC